MRSLPFALALLAVAGCRTTAPPPEPPKPVTIPAATPEDPPVQPPRAETLVKPPPPPPVSPGVYESRSVYPQTEVTEWVFTNGVRLGFKPTPFEPRRLRVLLYAPGGMRAAPDSLAAAVLGRTVASADFTARITEGAAELAGAASTEALEDRLRAAAAWLADPPASAGPGGVSVDEALSLLLDGKPFSTGGAVGAAVDPFAWAFDDPRRLLVVIVGDASPAEVERTAAVFARLRPSLRAVLEADSLAAPPRMPRRAVEVTLPAHGPAAAAIGFRGEMPADYDARAGLDVLARVLTEAVRDRTGQDVRVEFALDFSSGVAEVRLTVEGRGVDAERFRRDVLREVSALRAEAPPGRVMAMARAQAREAHEAALATNAGWVDWLSRLLRNDQDTREAPAYGRRLSGVPASRVRELAEAVLDPDRYVLVARPAD